MKKFLTPIHVRLFLTMWVVFTVYFATNTVREHYPAFSLIENGTLKLDRYKDYHPDIFVHSDGHAYIGNNVAASYIAAVPLFIFKPVLDMFEKYEKDKIRHEGIPDTKYRNEKHANSRAFFRLAKEEGMTLRFGAATVVTSAFLMAPMSALIVLLMFHILRERGVQRNMSLGLALLFGFGTPIFFRSAILNHNVMVMFVTFLSFYLLWARSDKLLPVSVRHRLVAGFLAGFGLALDYGGVVPLILIYGYLVGARLQAATLKTAILESIPFIIGSVPPVLFLLYTQWEMFGNPFMPGQYWMPDVTDMKLFGEYKNPYSTEGFRGFDWPSPDLFWHNLFHPVYGLYIYGPILALALIPTSIYKSDKLILPRPERIFVMVFFIAMLVFYAANQYSRLQTLTGGFRYLVPMVPFLYLALVDHLVRMPKRWLIVLIVPVLVHSWVISMVREPAAESWQQVVTHGLQFPWLNVLKMTMPVGHWINNGLIPIAILILAGLVVSLIWKIGPANTE